MQGDGGSSENRPKEKCVEGRGVRATGSVCNRPQASIVGGLAAACEEGTGLLVIVSSRREGAQTVWVWWS